MTFKNFHLLLSHGILLGSQTHLGHEGFFPAAQHGEVWLLCSSSAEMQPRQGPCRLCTHTVLSSGTAAGTVLSSGHLPPLGHTRAHPGPEILTKVLIKTRSAS